MYLLLFILAVVKASTVDKISWTLSKPPAKLLQWDITSSTPSYTVPSLSPGHFILQAIASSSDGTATHSGVIQGNITKTAQQVSVVMNPLIQADATRYNQPAYIKSIRTNTTTVYSEDVILISIEAKTNPPGSSISHTIDGHVVGTSTGPFQTIYKIPPVQAPGTHTIQISLVGMGYSVPLELKVVEPTAVQISAVFNTPPTIDYMASAISMLHQIGTSTTITASFSDDRSTDVKYSWSITAIQGRCLSSELGGVMANTVPSGSTVSIIYTPTSLNNRCLIQIRCEDLHGAASLGEVIVYVDSIKTYFPPYVVSKFQSKQTASVNDVVSLSLEQCEPQKEMVTSTWSSSCSTLDHSKDIVANTDNCFWIYNKATITSLPCSINVMSVDQTGSVSNTMFRVFGSLRRRLKTLPNVEVKTTSTTLTTSMSWFTPLQKKHNTPIVKEEKTQINGEGIALIFVSILLVGSIVGGVFVWKRRETEDVVPEKKPLSVRKPHIGLDVYATKMNNVNKFKKKLQENHIEITPEMMAKGAIKQMKIHRNSKKHVPPPPQHVMVERSAEGDPKTTPDSAWLGKIKHSKG